MKNTNSIKKYYILKAVVDGISQITGLSCSILTESDFKNCLEYCQNGDLQQRPQCLS